MSSADTSLSVRRPALDSTTRVQMREFRAKIYRLLTRALETGAEDVPTEEEWNKIDQGTRDLFKKVDGGNDEEEWRKLDEAMKEFFAQGDWEKVEEASDEEWVQVEEEDEEWVEVEGGNAENKPTKEDGRGKGVEKKAGDTKGDEKKGNDPPRNTVSGGPRINPKTGLPIRLPAVGRPLRSNARK